MCDTPEMDHASRSAFVQMTTDTQTNVPIRKQAYERVAPLIRSPWVYPQCFIAKQNDSHHVEMEIGISVGPPSGPCRRLTVAIRYSWRNTDSA